MAKAKEEGLVVEIHWQDGDSSSSKSVEEIFPKAKVMICGGHAGRSHLKQLQALAKKKRRLRKMIKKNTRRYSQTCLPQGVPARIGDTAKGADA